MTPGPIDLKIVSNRLDLVDRYLGTLRTIPSASLEQFLADERNPAAAESVLTMGFQPLAENVGVRALVETYQQRFAHAQRRRSEVSRRAQ